MDASLRTVPKPHVVSAVEKVERICFGTLRRVDWECMYVPIATDDRAAALPQDPSPRDMDSMTSGREYLPSSSADAK